MPSLRLPRRRPPAALPLVLISLLPLLSACGNPFGGSKSTPTPSPTPTVTSTATSTPTSTPPPSPTPPPPTPTPIPPARVSQGGFAVVHAPAGGASATATFEGRQYPMTSYAGGYWAIVGIGPLDDVGQFDVSVSYADASGNAAGSADETLVVVAREFPTENIDLEPGQGVYDPAAVQRENDIREQVRGQFTPQKLWSGPFIFPLQGEVSSPYGIMRSYNGGPVSEYHHGTDFAADEGAPVAAAASGRVAFAGALTVRGNTVMIDHGLGVFTSYNHLSRIDVQEGQVVTQGQIIAAVGSTGLATGPHLHWEVAVRGVDVDPVLWTYEDVGP